ncbi:MAG: hypothetical protein UH734_00930 [Ruminococcus sp.]|nr:hypothetical protein [Ruminococcus sp.]
MAEKKYFIDDRVIIPEEIRSMTKEQLEAEIAKFEAEIAIRKNLLNQHKKETA